MPLDGKITDFDPITVPVAKPFDFSTATPDERLLELARVLDDQQAWRDQRLVWNFKKVYDNIEGASRRSCGTAGCALGLASIIWPQWTDVFSAPLNGYIDPLWAYGRASIVFGMRIDQADDLFGRGLSACLDLKMSEIAPHHVSFAIRQFVAARSGA